MKIRKVDKRMPLFTVAVLLLAVLAGCDLLTGPAGSDGVYGGNIPGGFFHVSASGLSVDSVVRIVFDPDSSILSGNESHVVIPVGDYQVEGHIDWIFSWRAPNVSPGSYFIYYWTDYDGDSTINSEDEEFSFDLYDPGNYYFVDLPPSFIGFETPLTVPNYTFWSNFAPQLDLPVSIPIPEPY